MVISKFNRLSLVPRHFPSYCHTFHTVVLEEEVLPLLLLGIRDLNDQLVADSLRALAEVVPILGASKVIGKNRRKIFSDGAPGKVKNAFFSSFANFSSAAAS